jgi:Protein of unknown function (DUF2905)
MRYVVPVMLFIAAVAALTMASIRYGLGRLPGDIVVDRGNGFYFYAPFTTAILVSLLLGLGLWLIRR